MSACIAQTVTDIADEVSASEGVSLTELEPSTALRVRTRNSEYRIIVLRGTTLLLTGGRRFPHFAACRINGSGLGGSLLKLAWIGVGLRMEICVDGRCIVTSPVREITTEVSPSLDRWSSEHASPHNLQ